MITDLVFKYEASGDPGAVSDGSGDLGGVSYGIFQLASNTGAVKSFLDWAATYEDEALAAYANVLCEFPINSQEFIKLWRKIGSEDPQGFGELQGVYAANVYFYPAAEALQSAGYDPLTKSEAVQQVLFSRAVQYSSGNMVELFNEAVHSMYNCEKSDHSGWPNLSYVNDRQFDYDLIAAVYDFLISECDAATYNGKIYHSPKDWVNGSADVVAGLRNRFVHEKADALEAI